MEFIDDIHFKNLNPVCHLGGFFSIGANEDWSLGAEKYLQNKFYYIKSGRCEIIIEGVKYEGIAGRWFFIPAGVNHYYFNDKSEPFSKFWMHFDLYPNTVNFFTMLDLPYYIDITDKKTEEKLDGIFGEFSKAIYGNKVQDKLREKVCLIELFEMYITLANQTREQISVPKPNTRPMKNVTRYIEDNIEKNLTIKELADFCHLHPNYFIRTFKEKTGLTPSKYVRTIKMETAKRLVEETDLSFLEIMSKVGFDDASHFSKLFKSHYGTSPQKWRKQTSNAIKHFYKNT